MEIIVKNKDFSVEQQKQIELLNQYLLKSALNLSRNCSQKEKNEDTSAQGIKPFIKPIVKTTTSSLQWNSESKEKRPLNLTSSLEPEDILVQNANINIDRKAIVKEYENTILSIISTDEYEDGVISNSERFIKEKLSIQSKEYILDALMQIYISKYDDEHVLLGVMEMISCMKYDEAEPKGQIMALGLLQHKNIYLRDRAIQVYEQWNSKKGISALKNLRCDQKWLQDYVDKAIKYLERDGE